MPGRLQPVQGDRATGEWTGTFASCGPMQRARSSRDFVFDLNPIRAAFARERGEENGTVRLELGARSLDYSF